MRPNLFDVAVVRPVLVAAVTLVLCTLGIYAGLNLPIREFPDVDPPSVSINTVYVGAQAGVVEREVTRIIEEGLSGVSGVRQIRSTTRDEASDIELELLAGTDLDAAAADVRDRVASVRNDLPDGVEEPLIEKATSDDDPIVILTLRSDTLDAAALTDIADRLVVDAIGVIPGVARVDIGGEKLYAMRIRLDRTALAARGLTAGDVAARLEAENLELPAGELRSDAQSIGLRTDTRFASAEDFRALSLIDRDGVRVTLGDVADVSVGVENEDTAFRINGAEAVSLEVIRQTGANTLEVATAIREEVAALADQLPQSVVLEESFSAAEYIRENLRNVVTTLLVSVGVIVAVLFVFLGSARATIIPALTIPASVIPAAIVAVVLGYSINVLTILAVILAISLCTDDAVVIMENIRRRQQKGEPLLLASSKATREIGVAVFAGALVLFAVVLPLAVIPGNVGLIFREFAVTLAAIIAFSTLAALLLSPMLSARLFSEDDRPGRLERVVGSRLALLSERYRHGLGRALDRPTATVLVALGVVALAALAFTRLPGEVAPDEDRGSLTIIAQGPEGSSAAYMAAQLERIEAIVREASGENGPVAAILSTVAPGRSGQGDTSSGRVTVVLRDWSERDEGGLQFQERLQGELGAVTGVRALALAPNGLAIGGRPIDVVLRGTDRESLAVWADEVVEGAADVPGLVGFDSDYADRTPQLSVQVDRSRAAALGIDTRQIGETLQIMFGEAEITRYVERGEEYEVIVQSRDRLVPTDVENVFVRAGANGLVPLSSVVTLSEISVASELQRVDRQPAVLIGGGLQGGSLGDVLAGITAVAENLRPDGTSITFTGQSLDFQESQSAFLLILGLILVLAYLILAGQFESFLDPLVILVSAPAAIAGGVFVLYLAGLSVNVYTQVAMLLLIGLVAKNAILLVEFAKQERERGAEPREAILEACALRLRPILMTTAATIIGAIPLLMESGAGAEARFSVGLVIASGTTLGTLLTLFVVPVLWFALARFTQPRNEVAERLARYEENDRKGEVSEAVPTQG